MMKLLTIVVLALPLAAAPVFNNSGSADLTCGGLDGRISPPITIGGAGPSVSLDCPAGYISANVNVSASNLNVGGGANGTPIKADYLATSQMQDTITNTNGTGTGMETFTITFDWLGIDDPGGSDVQAKFLFNGSLVWSEDHPTRGHLNTFPQESVATIEEPFIYGQPLGIEADITASGGSGPGSPNYTLSTVHGTLTVTESTVPEPNSVWLVGIGAMGIFIGAAGGVKRKLRTRKI
jgi:PEP-CTERM motif